MNLNAKLLSVWFVMGGLIVGLSDSAHAQTRTTGGTSGLGGIGGSGGLSGSSAFGGGTNRFSTTNANTAGTQSIFSNQQSNFGFQGNTNQNGFLGGRNSQTFLGGNQRNAQTNQQQQQNQFGNRNNRGRQNQMDMNDFDQQSQSGQDSRRAIRPQQKVAFDVPRREAVEIRSTLQTRFETVSQNLKLRDVTCDLDGEGVVTLRGSVESKSSKLLAANMARLEPGVKRVVNEIDIQADAAK